MARAFFILAILLISFNAFSQYKKEILNPFVNPSELHWLKSQKIDLSQKSLTDPDFIKTIRETLEYKSNNRKTAGKFTVLLALFTFTTVSFTIGDYNTSSSAFRNTLMGTLSVTTGVLATKYYLKLRYNTSQEKQRLKVAQKKYKLLMQ